MNSEIPQRIARAASVILAMVLTTSAQAQNAQPNILVIWGDDIGIFNISAYSHGMMGYQTPNIDRVAKEGAIFTDLRSDPFEEASVRGATMYYDKWHFQRSYVLVPAAAYVGQFLKTFDEFPPRSKAASFSVGDALSSIQTASQGKEPGKDPISYNQ